DGGRRTHRLLPALGAVRRRDVPRGARQAAGALADRAHLGHRRCLRPRRLSHPGLRRHGHAKLGNHLAGRGRARGRRQGRRRNRNSGGGRMHSARLIDVAVASEEQAAPAVSREMQELWFAIADRAWSSLLLVPSGTVEVLALAAGLCEVSYQTASPRPVALLDASGASLEQAAALARQLALRVARDERVLVVVDPVR